MISTKFSRFFLKRLFVASVLLASFSFDNCIVMQHPKEKGEKRKRNGYKIKKK